MHKLMILIVISFSSLILAPTAHADTLNPIALTPNEANTNFTLTGTYYPGTPTTPFSAPNTPWVLTFTLETTPSSLAFALPDVGLFAINTTVSLNQTLFPASQIVFFNLDPFGGGLVVCLSVACYPGYPPAANFFDVFTSDPATGDPVQLFTGNVTAPTFVQGTFSEGQFAAGPIDGNLSSYAITPEPSSLMLLGTGLFGLGVFARHRLQRRPK